MKRTFFVTVVFLLLTAADEKTDPTKDDVKLLQGTWIFLPRPKNYPNEPTPLYCEIVIAGNKMTMKWESGRDNESTIELDATKNPKQISRTFKSPPPPPQPRLVRIDGTPNTSGNNCKGIYSIDGDTLKIFWGDEKERPKEFPKQGNDILLPLWKLKRKTTT